MNLFHTLVGGGASASPDTDTMLAAQQRLPHWIAFLEDELAELQRLMGADGGTTTAPASVDAGAMAVQPLTGFKLIEE